MKLWFLAALALVARASTGDKRQTLTCVPQDIVFMIDSSSYVGVEHFQEQKDFIKQNLRYYNLNPACTRIGIMSYSSGVYNQFYLNGYSTMQQMYTAIDGIKYQAGGSNTGDAFNYLSSTAFSTANGGRTDVPHYGVLVTGSTSSSPSMTVSAAHTAQQNGINLLTVGVGSGVNQGELSGVASNEKNQFYSQNYNTLPTLAQPLAARINGAVTPQTISNLGGTGTSCLQQADIVFMVDGSGSIGSANFVKLENFVKGIVGKLDVGANKVHVGFMQFSNYPAREFPLNMYTNRADVMTGIDQVHYMGGGTNTGDALKYLRENMFSTSAGARTNVPRIAVVITDGKSSNPTLTATEANNARGDNIGLLAVGIGGGVDANELHAIADDPDSANTFQVNSYDQLDSISTQIVNRACQVHATAAPASTNLGNSGPETCNDRIADCKNYGQSVCSGSYFGWAKDNCPRYCGFCIPVYTTAPPACVDALTNCNEFEPSACVGQFKQWATDNCRKFCGYCSATSQSVGFYGNCYYKGQTYSQGENWDDGCDYSCTCMDGATGKYQCFNKCPVYHDLPSTCTLVKSDSQCCLQPVCDFNPKLTTFESTSHGLTPDGVDVCMYKNHQYYQGQTWDDGCDYSCTCTNSKMGVYSCQTLCPDYTNVPSFCHMVKAPGECCNKPVCEFKTQQGSFTGTGTISGHGTGISPTAPPACTDNLPDCDRYGQDACINFKPWARDNCAKTCQLCVNNAPNPDPTDVCIYNGQAFHQGETWQEGCDTVCTCENAVYGYYRCVNTCPTYTNIPATCQLVKKTGDCCSSVQCQPGTGTFISSTGNLNTIGGGGLIVPGTGGVVPTLPSGATPQPGTGGTGVTAPSLNGCLYKGNLYIQGQTWDDGCQYACVCKDGSSGLYECRAKCPMFPNLPSECHLQVDSSDPCCQKPVCQFTGTPVPVLPVFGQTTTGHNVVAPPSPNELYQGTQTIHMSFTVPGATPAPPTAGTGVTGGIGHCEYKGQTYLQGQTWEDGCTYNCVCEDASIGFYRCREKCQNYGQLPPECTLIQDPNNNCCKIPKCTFVGTNNSFVVTASTPSYTTHSPVTFVPAPQSCVYKGQSYSQGQTWYDGCDYRCTCDDASAGVYRCMKRCPEFFTSADSSNCVNIPDPNDPGCCVVPQCTPTPAPGSTLAPNVIGTIAPGTFVGQPNTTSYVGFCSYKGHTYRQGEVWQDGCDYTCTCKDESTGRYECVDRCPSYGAMPPQCTLVADYANPCCQRPNCQFNGNYNEISGTLTPRPGTVGPNPIITQAPKISYCVYKNAQYSQGQTWNDGCSFNCRCDDAARGLYVCNDRCPKYENIPPQCVMVTDPTDSCCTQPKCDFGVTPGVITGTLAPNMIPTKVPSVIYGQANTPAPTPGPGGVYPSPQPLSYCSYKGVQYSQGQVWDDGCDYTCRCVDASMGKYQCDEKCTQYTGLPAQCRLIKDAAKPCCFKPICDFSGTFTQITGQLTTPVPTPGPGQNPTLAPNPNPNPNPYPTPGLPKSVCQYKTDVYTQGQQWFDGCNFKCVCEDASQGVYRCSKRCAEYPSIPAGCTMVSDPADPICCKVPQCAPQPNNTAPIPTAPPGVISGGSVTLAPQPMTTLAPGIITQQPPVNPTPAPTPKCVYKGKMYAQGQRWQDGCDYNCECVDAAKGMYNCVEICSKYPNLPAACQMVRDLNKPCCMVPKCDFSGTHTEVTGSGPTPAPQPGSTVVPVPGTHNTPAPTPKAYCTYNGVQFKQGERWDDGCDLKCVCENEMTGYYRCNQRCAQYNSVPAGCTLQTDPNDPCCRVPVCVNLPTPAPTPYNPPTPVPGGPTLAPGLNPTPGPNPAQTPNPYPTPYVPTLAPPVVIGQGVTPTPNPQATPNPNPNVTPTPKCIYNGVAYTQGQKWDDGCQYHCVCDNAMTGQYRCTERCPVYPQLPTGCRLVTSPTDPCCKVPQCTVLPTPAPQPTQAPNLNPTQSPIGPGPTPAPNPSGTSAPTPMPVVTPAPQTKSGCVMNGKLYTQGQRWNDGCNQVCVCDNSMTGHYTCTERCKVYASIPKECTMVPDPADPLCCQVPQCIPVPGTNGYPTPSPTDGPIVYTNAPHAVVTGTGTPPTMPTVAPQPGVTTPAPTPAPEVCVYKGVTYLQDQRWQDGCDFNCICTDGKTGKYTCTARCGSYPNVPRECTLQRDANDYCCYVPVCNWNPTPAPNPYSSPAPQPTSYPGQPTPAPGTLSPNPAFTPAPQPKSFCVYNGVTFGQGQSIKDGCSKTCRCDNADTNYYNCFDRCPSYPNLGPTCYMVTDPNDPCCQVPYCSVIPTPAPNPMSTPVPNPFMSTQAPHLVPGQPTPNPTPVPNPYTTLAPVPTGVTGQIINNPDPTRPTSQKGFCVYQGKSYTTGQTWDDGCNYRCVCLDDMTGQYKCTERCPRFPTVPSYCVMVQDPNDMCCKTVSCNGLTPTLAPNQTPAPIPGQTPVPVPGVNPTPAPSPGVNPNPTLAPTYSTNNPFVFPTPAPQPTQAPIPVPKNVCVMSGKSYTQGQRWYDGCKQICVCDDGMTGHYTCNQRCATYNNIQPTCVFVPDPKDPMCCQVPECHQPNSTINTPIFGTHTGGGPQPTPRPNYTPAPVPGVVTLYPGGPTMVPMPLSTLVPNPNPNPNPTLAPTPGPKVCVYKGASYTQGQKWRDGCQYDCTCTDAEHGKYTCNDVCPTYPGLPVYCTMVYDPMNPCCKKPDCSTPAPQPQPSPAPGFTNAPTPSPKTQFCVYKGLPLKLGETFNDGCSKICRCEDTMSNSVVCDDRCPTYPPLGAGCTMTTDPRDQCCQVPYCPPVNPVLNPNQTIVTGVPGTISGHTQPNPVPGSVPVTGARDACLYQGKVYTTGQTWDDGCTYHCVCVNGMTGDYQCQERCARYPKLPAQCTLVQDPNDICCQKPHCDFMAPTLAPTPGPQVGPTPGPQVGPTPAPHVGPTPAPHVGPTQAPHVGPTFAPQPGSATTVAPPVQPKIDVCVYGGQMYRQDQVWYDGCNAVCTCENAATGYYRCQERCAQYTSVPATCTMVPDPKDPSCCKVADCPSPPTSVPPTVGYLIPNPSTPQPPKINGIAPVPTPQPTLSPPLPGQATPAPMPKTGCYYKNQVYAQGQTWDDGCDFNCQCVDDMTGQYTCTKRCTEYPSVPPQCVLVQDPKDTCCQVPYCDFINPTPFPNGIPTPAPQPGQTPAPTLAPGVMPTPLPQGYCVYKGVYYTQGQQWNDGCQKKCTCDDVTKGYYSCTDRCPVYDNIPSTCRMVTDPNDACCLLPDCNTFTLSPTQPGGISGHNTQPPIQGGTYPPVTGTNAPIIVAPTYVPAVVTGSSNNNPFGSYNNGPTGRNNVCVYKGVIHNQGETWDDACTYKCTCVDALRGQYRCAERCPRYVNLPAYCTYQQDPNDSCCKVARCDLSQIPTLAPPTLNPPYTVNPNTGNPITGNPATFNPNTGGVVTGSNIPINPTGGTITGSRDKCIYKDNSQHTKGSTWQDGCDYTCICEDPVTNDYRCTARCKLYHDLPSSCFLVTDPSDQCCKAPSCSGSLVPQTISGTNPTGPSGSNVVPIGTHTTFSGSGRPDVVPGMSTSGSRNVCVYKGTPHQQGESWDDGCTYTCTCNDASRGLYQCTSKCPAYPSSIPSYCKLNKVPGMCCEALSCNIPNAGTYQPSPQLVATHAPAPVPGQVPTPAPQVIYPSGTQPVIGGGNQYPGGGFALPPGTSSGSIRNQCVYKNRLYNQGEKWDDGCDYQCECMDAKSGYYRCQPLCAQYTLPQNCFTVQAAGQCCEQPVCRRPDGSQFNPLQKPSSLYPVYGSYPTGMGGFRPGYNPSTGTTNVSGQSAVCVYKGRIFTQNQQWDDGCEYTCQCTDAAHGMYTCNEMCPSYTTLPASCHMTQLPGQCCKVPQCNQLPSSSIATPLIHPTPSMTGCYDAINNCNAYGRTACQAPYDDWAKQNCNKYCGYCTDGTVAPPNTGCFDALNNCNSYGQSACTGIYAAWAMDNCKKTCNLCSTVTTSAPIVTQAPQPSGGNCVDKLTNCADYGTGGCQAPYEQWAIDNCAKFCGKCDAVGVYPTGTSGQLPNNNWMIMLKGVAGAPGDLYSLWNGQNTLNENVPQAMYLTAQYPGHYKPDLSNYWNQLCIDKVKVAIYNNGVEKANIVFDATGSDKNSWFRKDKIISSTWTDIKYAPSNLFSLLGDPTTGREFVISSSGTGCNTNGWFVVSTQNNCNFEQGAAKPAFYYAPGQTSVNMAQVTPGSGDVFAILAHPNCGNNMLTNNPPQTTMGTTLACIYKNNIYNQGETWQDGCDYNCTCENATSGFYRCNNLCPTWNNLPNGCTLQKQAGQCCSEPICGNHTLLDIKDTCYYKNNYYRQGEEWRDGCQYKCTCIDGPSGFYQCKTLCLQWNLPTECTMDPAPAGKCCPVPNCPNYIHINYPQGYVQE